MRLTPRAGRDAVEGVDGEGALLVRVHAAPVEGAANAGLLRLLAGVLDVAPREIEIDAGATSRRKRLLLSPRAAERLVARFPGVRVEAGTKGALRRA